MLRGRRTLDLGGRAAGHQRRSDVRLVPGRAHTNGPIPAGTVIRAASQIPRESSTEDTIQRDWNSSKLLPLQHTEEKPPLPII